MKTLTLDNRGTFRTPGGFDSGLRHDFKSDRILDSTGGSSGFKFDKHSDRILDPCGGDSGLRYNSKTKDIFDLNEPRLYKHEFIAKRLDPVNCNLIYKNYNITNLEKTTLNIPKPIEFNFERHAEFVPRKNEYIIPKPPEIFFKNK